MKHIAVDTMRWASGLAVVCGLPVATVFRSVELGAVVGLTIGIGMLPTIAGGVWYFSTDRHQPPPRWLSRRRRQLAFVSIFVGIFGLAQILYLEIYPSSLIIIGLLMATAQVMPILVFMMERAGQSDEANGAKRESGDG